MVIRRSKMESWLAPVVYLSNNWLSRMGVALVTAATVFSLFLLPSTLHIEEQHPYLGLLSTVALPGVFIFGLVLIPFGIWLRVRREQRKGIYPTSFGPLSLRSVELRRLLVFVGLMTALNVVLGATFAYRAVHYMDSVSFCGQACHKVMAPEFAAYQNSPHSRVECVACHIGPGASWFVKSKLSGSWQLIAVTFNLYPRPIPTPVQALRPARETCETCHWPQKFGADRLRIVSKYADDETNSLTKSVLLMRIGGGAHGGPGIHGVHLGAGVNISYSPAAEDRQVIPRVEYRNQSTGRTTVYLAADTKPEAVQKLPTRLMDCMDCHNRPTHEFQLPDTALNQAMTAGAISPGLPFIKKTSLEVLRKNYPSQEEASVAIPAAIDKFYRETYPAVYQQRKAEIARAAGAVVGIYKRNIFPQMNVTWGTYPNNIGHMDFPGCFRCHDDNHAASDGRKIGQDCNSCHQILAMDEAAPKILTDLGLANGK